MNKYLPYVLGGIAVVVLLILVVTTPFGMAKRLDERITLRQKDKIPYGTNAAFRLLPLIFPNAEARIEKASPANWDFDSSGPVGKAIFLTARIFEPEEYELEKINRFVERGNYVFIIANSISFEAARSFHASGSGTVFYMQPQDSLQLTLTKPLFTQNKSFVYPGKKWDSYFSETDRYRVRILGRDALGNPNFIWLQKGRGQLFVHLAPLAFSNYFILHKNNVQYFQQALSVIPASVSEVVWNEYYLAKRRKNEKDPNFLSVLWQYPAFKWGLLTALATLLLYTLIEMRRRRSMIPLVQRPANESLDYVQTLGRLYYDKKDHLNLAKKMTAVFLDAVRNRYHLSTQKLDADFMADLHYKSGYDPAALQGIVQTIQEVKTAEYFSEQQLAQFHQQLENFYQYT